MVCTFLVYLKMLIPLVMMVAVVVAGDSEVNIMPVDSTGFHYEFQSNLGFVVNSWSFILNVDYTVLLSRLDQLGNVSNTLLLSLDNELSNCNLEDGGGFKRELQYLIDRKIVNLVEMHRSIEYLLIHKKFNESKRQRRELFGGFLNFVGRFYKYTIGVMDDRDAKVLYELANRSNSTEYRIKTLTNETMQIAKYLESIKHDLEHEHKCEYLERQLVYLKDNLEEIETVYNKIVIGIQMALYGSRLSSLILNPQTLLEELNNIDSNQWDKESEWVVEPRLSNMHTIMHITKCNVFINPRDQLMFIIQVPRVDKTKFVMYKPVSIPLCNHESMCKFLTPQSQYIGFESNGNKQHYIRLDDTSTCTQIENNTLCYGSVTSQKIQYSSDCDVRMFKGMDTSPHCSVHASQFHDEIFYSLNGVNRWLFLIGNHSSVNAFLNCGTGNYNKRITLKGTGILTLLKYCKLRTTRSVLTSKHVPDYNEDSFQIVKFDFSKYILPDDYVIGNKIIKSLDYDTLNDVTHSLKKLMTQEDADRELLFKVDDDDNSWSDWYLNLFGNWWWELKFCFYAVCVVIIIVFIKTGGGCVTGSNKIVLPILSPK